jgi:hypothetical protein
VGDGERIFDMSDNIAPMAIFCGSFHLILSQHDGLWQWEGTTAIDIKPGVMFQINDHLPFMRGMFILQETDNLGRHHIVSDGIVTLSMNDPTPPANEVCFAAGELSDAYKAVEEHRDNPTVLRTATLTLLKAVEKWRTVSGWKSDGGSSSSPA